MASGSSASSRLYYGGICLILVSTLIYSSEADEYGQGGCGGLEKTILDLFSRRGAMYPIHCFCPVIAILGTAIKLWRTARNITQLAGFGTGPGVLHTGRQCLTDLYLVH